MPARPGEIVTVWTSCDMSIDGPNYWYEVETDHGDGTEDEVIHSDGFFETRDEASKAGEAWAEKNGYLLAPL